METYIVAIAILAGVFTFYMGYIDGTSAIASSVATNALKPLPAFLISTISMFIAPIIVIVLMGSDSVARTVGSLVYTDAYLNISPNVGFVFLLAALIAAILWAIVSLILVVPNSVSHTLLGGIVGSGIVIFSFNSIDWSAVWVKVIIMVFFAPILGLLIGFIMQKLFVLLCSAWPRTIKKAFKALQSINIVLLSISIAANNIQKTLGVYLLAKVLCSQGGLVSFDSFEFSWWIVVIFAFIQCLGLIFGGEKLINVIGYRLHRLSTVQSYVAQLSTIIISFASTFVGLPISTTQVVSSSIMGVGAAEGISTVSWKQGDKMIMSWIVTFPASMIFGILVALLLKAIIL